MAYTKVFDNPYPNGWENYPSEETPVTANALQEHTDAIVNMENYLYTKSVLDGDNVSISSPQSGQFLVYNSTTSKWENTTIANAEEESF